MAKLTETNKWEEEIYRIETTDPVQGGEDGIANKGIKQLANRTQFLKAKTTELETNLNREKQTLTDKDAENLALLQQADTTNLSTIRSELEREKQAIIEMLTAQKQELITLINNTLMPVGAILGFSKDISTVTGFLALNGQSINKSQYPKLFAVLAGNNLTETFTLPNLNQSNIGQLAYFTKENLPTGWLECNGQSISKSDYPDLVDYLNAGQNDATLPNIGDRFIRGRTESLSIGTTQSDAMRNITGHVNTNHSLGLYQDSSYGGVFRASGGGGGSTGGQSGWWYKGFNFDASRQVTTADEFRPKAVAYLLAIKAFDDLNGLKFWIKHD